MAPLLTVDQLREHIETDVTDAALQRYLDTADYEIVEAFGANTGTVIEYFTPGALDCLIFTVRKIASVSAIVETTRGPAGDTETTLASNDYVVDGNRQIRRLATGTNGASYWAERTKVTYTPTSESAKRIGVTIDLVRLSCRYEAASSTKLGDVSINHVDYAQERQRILRRLQPGPLGIWA